MPRTLRWSTGLTALLLVGTLETAPASPESVRLLMDMTKTRSIMESMMANVETPIRQGATSAIAQRGGNRESLTDAQRGAIDWIVGQVADLMRSELRWDILEPEYVKMYVDTFDQEEVDGMIAFYRTSTGQALITKIPLVLQRSVALSQALMPKVLAMVAEEVKSLQ